MGKAAGKKDCMLICGFFLFHCLTHILTSQFCPHLYWKAKVGLGARLRGWKEACLVCNHRTLVSLMQVLIFAGCITLHAPDCCPPTAKLCPLCNCRWSRCADEKWSQGNREVHSSVKLNLSPDWEKCRMLRKFTFGHRHLILAHILVY